MQHPVFFPIREELCECLGSSVDCHGESDTFISLFASEWNLSSGLHYLCPVDCGSIGMIPVSFLKIKRLGI